MTFESISSRKNEKIIFAASLKDKKNRDKHSLFFVEGRKLFYEALCCGMVLHSLYFTERAKDTALAVLKSAGVNAEKAYEVSESVYEKLTAENSPEGIFAVFEKFETFCCEDISHGGFVILEDIQNPSNLGTVIRSACALGMEKIIITKKSADIFGSKTCRAAMGALFRAGIYIADDLCAVVARLSKYGRVFGAALCEGAKSVEKVNFSPNDSIVIGNEGAGISEEVLRACSDSVIIPMHNGTESLNAAAAAAILIWEMSKQSKQNF